MRKAAVETPIKMSSGIKHAYKYFGKIKNKDSMTIAFLHGK